MRDVTVCRGRRGAPTRPHFVGFGFIIRRSASLTPWQSCISATRYTNRLRCVCGFGGGLGPDRAGIVGDKGPSAEMLFNACPLSTRRSRDVSAVWHCLRKGIAALSGLPGPSGRIRSCASVCERGYGFLFLSLVVPHVPPCAATGIAAILRATGRSQRVTHAAVALEDFAEGQNDSLTAKRTCLQSRRPKTTPQRRQRIRSLTCRTWVTILAPHHIVGCV